MSDFISGVGWFAVSSLIGLYQSYVEVQKQQRCIGKNKCQLPSKKATSTRYDVVIVGAGPAGSTAAYYLGRQGRKVCLADKKKFPRQKVCGDAWCKPALDILEDMGVLHKMEADGIVGPVTRGGLISPFGHRCINTDGSAYGSVTGCKTYAIKRQIADEYLVRAAASHSTVDLMEECEVVDARFIQVDPSGREIEVENVASSKHSGWWRVTLKRRKASSTDDNAVDPSTLDSNSAHAASAAEDASETFTLEAEANMLLICDGTTSYLAQKLGIIPKGNQPEAVCSHAYIKGGTHTWTEADGVMLFTKSILPGYSALFRHYNGDVYFGTYILPGGRAKATTIAPFEIEAFEKHPYVKAALGDKFQWEERRVVAPIRLSSGVPQSYARQALVVGDAAGHVDPLTGEGIHTAMIAGKIAAQAIGEMNDRNDFSLEACRAYELRCYDAFVGEFSYSAIAARVIYHFPISIDAVAVVGQRRGQAFLDFFGEVMTGVKPKSEFLKADLIVDLSFEIIRQMFLQWVLRSQPLIPEGLGQAAVEKSNKKR